VTSAQSQSLTSNVSLAMIVSFVGRVTGFLLFFLVARRVTPTGAGAYALAMSYVALLLPISTLGLNDPMARDVAVNHNLASTYLGHLTLLRLLSGLAAYAILVILTTQVFHYPAGTTAIVLIMGLSILPDGLSQVHRSLFTAFERQSYYAVTAISASVVNLVLVAMLLRSDANLEVVAWARLASVLLGMAVGLILTIKFVPPGWLKIILRPDWRWMGRQLRVYLPFTLMAVLYTLEWRADIVILSAARTQREVGQYYAAETLLISFLLLLEAYRLGALPRMSRLLRENPQQLASLHDRSFWFLFAIAMPLAVGVSILGENLLSLLNPGFAAASTTLTILMVAMVVSFLNEPNSLLIVASGHQREVAVLFGISLSVNIGANLILVPAFGGTGSAVARVLSVSAFSVANALLVTRLVRRHSPWKYAPRVIAATMGMAFALWSLEQILPWWLAGLAAAGIYTVLVVALRGIPVGNLNSLWQRVLAHKRRVRKNQHAVGSTGDLDDAQPSWH
jgi:O-antigen/teichoic acid export membrane protein